MNDSLSLVIQAGGESRRMGEDKALKPFLGQPLILRVIDRLQWLPGEILITSSQPGKYAFLELKVFPDLYPGRGALGGLHAALFQASLPLQDSAGGGRKYRGQARLAANATAVRTRSSTASARRRPRWS